MPTYLFEESFLRRWGRIPFASVISALTRNKPCSVAEVDNSKPKKKVFGSLWKLFMLSLESLPVYFGNSENIGHARFNVFIFKVCISVNTPIPPRVAVH